MMIIKYLIIVFGVDYPVDEFRKSLLINVAYWSETTDNYGDA